MTETLPPGPARAARERTPHRRSGVNGRLKIGVGGGRSRLTMRFFTELPEETRREYRKSNIYVDTMARICNIYIAAYSVAVNAYIAPDRSMGLDLQESRDGCSDEQIHEKPGDEDAADRAAGHA
jgi:hypothetical protein